MLQWVAACCPWPMPGCVIAADVVRGMCIFAESIVLSAGHPACIACLESPTADGVLLPLYLKHRIKEYRRVQMQYYETWSSAMHGASEISENHRSPNMPSDYSDVKIPRSCRRFLEEVTRPLPPDDAACSACHSEQDSADLKVTPCLRGQPAAQDSSIFSS